MITPPVEAVMVCDAAGEMLMFDPESGEAKIVPGAVTVIVTVRVLPPFLLRSDM